MTSVLTLNAGLMRLGLFGAPLFEPAPFIPERYAGLADALQRVDADIVALQEIYRRQHKDGLAEDLAGLYPHVAQPHRPPWPLIDSGLMVLSKFPLHDFRLEQFRAGTPEERWLTYRGWMNGCIDTPDIGRVRLLNYHTTAGGLHRDPESALQDSRRRDQIDEVLQDAEGSTAADVQVLVGDLNAGPPASLDNYRQLAKAGFVDTYAPTGDRSAPGYVTWDSQQPLNIKGPHSFQKAQRIDQIFVRRSDLAQVSVTESVCVLDNPVVETRRGLTPVSDHYGVLARLDANRND